MGSLEQAIDSDDVHRHVLKFLDGKACRTASEAVVRWRKLQNEGWWREKARTDLSVGFWPADQEEDWLGVYKRCHRPPSLLKWVAGPLRSHCLGDRVAAPQMFASAKGERLYNYGGWTKIGPMTDLRCTSVSNLNELCRGAGAKPVFKVCPATGRPARRSGAQTLTPLWLTGGACEPSASHAAKLAPENFLKGGRGHLIVAYGGGGGGYTGEQNDWAVGVLDDDDVSEDPRVHWVRPGPREAPAAAYTARATTTYSSPMHRCAHTATYIPARCFGHDDFPEGAVLFFGGHAADTRTTLHHLQLLDVATWTWLTDERSGGLNYRLEPREATGAVARHGHTATLVEYDDQAYVVFVGGGRGTILEDPDRCEEFGNAQAVDVRSLYRRGTSRVRPRYGQLVALSSSYVPGRHHTASLVAPHTVALYGGGHRPMGGLWLLNVKEVVEAGKRVVAARAARARALQQCKEAAEKKGENILGLMNTQMQLLAEVKGAVVPLTEVGNHSGQAPLPRKFHAACSLYPWRPLVVVFGGWRLCGNQPDAIEQTQEWRQSRVDGVGRPKFDFHTGWRTGPHFEDLHVAALGADAKALDVYTRSPVAADVDDLEDGFLEIRVFVPELNTTETLRTSRSRLRFLVESGVFGAPTTAGGNYRFLSAPVPARPTMPRGGLREMWTREGNRVHIGIPEAGEGEVPTVDISLQRNMLYGSYAPTQPHAPHN